MFERPAPSERAEPRHHARAERAALLRGEHVHVALAKAVAVLLESIEAGERGANVQHHAQ